MNATQLFDQIQKKKSFLCIGLDTDPVKIPKHLLKNEHPVFEFNRQIIDATARYCVAYKPNIAFYESLGITGWKSLELTTDYIRKNYPEIFLIADAKRGDIGNTSKKYAETFFKTYSFDSVTVAPYMGRDSIEPFLQYPDKWVILLALTSNIGAEDFQFFTDTKKTKLFQQVLNVSKKWGTTDNMMYVVGATQASMLTLIREQVPDHFLLVPGVGAQGGSLKEVAQYGMNTTCGLLVNSSRGIIYADTGESFAKTAALKSKELQLEMEEYLHTYL
ncbi:MAG: orotidine-5'-phosphate decarboxylase [Bacteroidales bacterium]|nr:orotidine-5'-phosphate decarboxylase [Bacteroidales bacterium]